MKDKISQFFTWWLEGLNLLIPKTVKDKIFLRSDRMVIFQEDGTLQINLISGENGDKIILNMQVKNWEHGSQNYSPFSSQQQQNVGPAGNNLDIATCSSSSSLTSKSSKNDIGRNLDVETCSSSSSPTSKSSKNENCTLQQQNRIGPIEKEDPIAEMEDAS